MAQAKDSTDRKRVGPYTIIERLGEGGMGVVYRARSKDHEAAVKVIRASMLERDDIRTRFSREIETLKTVNSNFVARILGSDLSKKTAWLATEFVEGPTLKNLVDGQGPLPESEWWELAEGLFEGVRAIHDAGVIHQDLKPANIMMSPSGPKIIDFGISREVGATRVTMTGLFAGSAGWMAPERAELDVETTASDIFSVGLVLAFAALGKHPWDGETTQSDVALTLNMLREPPDLGGLSERQTQLVAALLDMTPENRPTGARALGMISGAIAIPVGMQPVRQGRKARPKGALARRRQASYTWQTSLAKGIGLAGSFVALTFFFGLFITTNKGNKWLEGSMLVASALAGNAISFSPSPSYFSDILNSATHATTTLALRPTLVTAFLLCAVYFLSKRLGAVRGMEGPKTQFAHGVALVSPVLVTAIALQAAAAAMTSRDTVPVTGVTIADVFFGGAILVLAYGAGQLSAQSVSKESAFGWFWLGLRRASLLALILALATIVSLIAYTVSAPVFIDSGLGRGPGSIGDLPLAEQVGLYGYVLAHLPTVLALLVSLVVGGQAGIYLLRDNSLSLQFLQGTTSVGPTAQLLPQDLVLAALAAVLVLGLAVISGASAAHRSGLRPKTAKILLEILGFSVLTWVLVVWLLKVSAVNPGAGLRGTLLFHPTAYSALISLVWAIVIGAFFALAMLLGARALVWKGVLQWLPRTTLGLGVFRGGEKSRRPLVSRIAGVAVIVLLVVTFVTPLGIGLGERAFAQANTPLALAEDHAERLELKDAEGLKALFPGSRGSIPWLPEKILETARPDLGQKKVFTISNDSRRSWRLGELDAQARVVWQSPAGPIQWDIPMEGSVERRFRYFRVVNYEASVRPVLITITVDEMSRGIDGASLSVNNFGIEPGTYHAVPGLYRISRNGVQLLASFKQEFTTKGPDVKVDVTAELELPDGAMAALTQAAQNITENCGSLRSGKCFSYGDVAKFMRLQSGQSPNSYYSKTETGYQEGRLDCSKRETTLLSARELLFEVDCIKTVSSQTVFYNSRQIAEPVYSVRCARYSYSWWFGFFCASYERYQSGTNYRTVRGDEMARANYLSEVPFGVRVRAELDDGGMFVIREAALR